MQRSAATEHEKAGATDGETLGRSESAALYSIMAARTRSQGQRHQVDPGFELMFGLVLTTLQSTLRHGSEVRTMLQSTLRHGIDVKRVDLAH